jgi:hypothetical protein
MPKLCLMTVPGLNVRRDWRLVHDRLLDEHVHVTDVLATVMPETILVTYDGAATAEVDAWLDTVAETILAQRLRCRVGVPARCS